MRREAQVRAAGRNMEARLDGNCGYVGRNGYVGRTDENGNFKLEGCKLVRLGLEQFYLVIARNTVRQDSEGCWLT